MKQVWKDWPFCGDLALFPQAETGRRTAALFALGYGAARFVSEYFREPDAFLGLQALGFLADSGLRCR